MNDITGGRYSASFGNPSIDYGQISLYFREIRREDCLTTQMKHKADGIDARQEFLQKFCALEVGAITDQ